MSKTMRIKRHPKTLRIIEVPAAQFKARCLEFMDRVSSQRQEFVITKRGKRDAKLETVEQEPVKIFGYMKGAAISYGDLIAPIDVVWEADQD